MCVRVCVCVLCVSVCACVCWECVRMYCVLSHALCLCVRVDCSPTRASGRRGSKQHVTFRQPRGPSRQLLQHPPPPACGVRRGCRKALCCAAPSSWRRHPSPRPPAPRLGHALLTCSILPLWPPSTGPLLREPSPTPSSGLWIGPRCTGSPAAAFGAPGACRRIATRDAQRRPRAAPVGGLLRPQS